MVLINRKENPSEYSNNHEVWLWSSNYYRVLWGILKNRKLPKNVDVKIGKRNFIIKAWHTKFSVDYFWESAWYIIRNISTGKAYTIRKWEEKILWKLWDILVDGDDIKASRKHLKLRVDEENNLFLHDISTNWTIVTEKNISESMNLQRYSIRKIKREEIDDLYEHKISEKEFSDDLINTYWEPKYVAEVKWKKWLLTDIIHNPAREHIWVIWYVLVDWVYEPRFYRKSKSEWDRRCAPEMDGWGIRVSKWESIPNASYESTTKVDVDLRQALDDPIIKINTKKWLQNPVVWSILEIRKEEIKIDKLFPSLPNWANSFFKGKTINDIKRDYKNLYVEWLNYMSMKAIPSKNFFYNHHYLWKICVRAYQAEYNGTNLIFYFAHAVDDPKKQVWVENVVYEDAPINVSWLYTKQVNFGPLAAKPIEYNDQIPRVFSDDARRYIYEKNWNSTYYRDIRDVYQENPIIKHYKKLEGLL